MVGVFNTTLMESEAQIVRRSYPTYQRYPPVPPKKKMTRGINGRASPQEGNAAGMNSGDKTCLPRKSVLFCAGQRPWISRPNAIGGLLSFLPLSDSGTEINLQCRNLMALFNDSDKKLGSYDKFSDQRC